MLIKFSKSPYYLEIFALILHKYQCHHFIKAAWDDWLQHYWCQYITLLGCNLRDSLWSSALLGQVQMQLIGVHLIFLRGAIKMCSLIDNFKLEIVCDNLLFMIWSFPSWVS